MSVCVSLCQFVWVAMIEQRIVFSDFRESRGLSLVQNFATLRRYFSMVAALIERHATALPVAKWTAYNASCQLQRSILQNDKARSSSTFISRQNLKKWRHWVRNVPSSLADLGGPPNTLKTVPTPATLWVLDLGRKRPKTSASRREQKSVGNVDNEWAQFRWHGLDEVWDLVCHCWHRQYRKQTETRQCE